MAYAVISVGLPITPNFDPSSQSFAMATSEPLLHSDVETCEPASFGVWAPTKVGILVVAGYQISMHPKLKPRKPQAPASIALHCLGLV